MLWLFAEVNLEICAQRQKAGQSVFLSKHQHVSFPSLGLLRSTRDTRTAVSSKHCLPITFCALSLRFTVTKHKSKTLLLEHDGQRMMNMTRHRQKSLEWDTWQRPYTIHHDLPVGRPSMPCLLTIQLVEDHNPPAMGDRRNKQRLCLLHPYASC